MEIKYMGQEPVGMSLIMVDADLEVITLQRASSDTPAIWFGPRNSRMLLNQDMVKALLPHLQQFAETGELE